jgi:hypothetical protein
VSRKDPVERKHADMGVVAGTLSLNSQEEWRGRLVDLVVGRC